MNEKELSIWTIYQKGLPPYPNNFVAKRFSIVDGTVRMTDDHMVAPRLEMIQQQLQRRGLVKLMPRKEDDPTILETWL